MCIIIYSPEGGIPKEHLDNGLDNNPDGWGIMWPKVNCLRTARGIRKKEFWKAWDKVPGDVPVAFHARVGTHGSKNIHNCHPFKVPKHEVAVMHNGIIKNQELPGGRSDTANFVNNILQHLPDRFWELEVYHELLLEYVGYSKLLFMDPKGATYIMGENRGDWINKIWYSNRSYEARNWIQTSHGTYVKKTEEALYKVDSAGTATKVNTPYATEVANAAAAIVAANEAEVKRLENLANCTTKPDSGCPAHLVPALYQKPLQNCAHGVHLANYCSICDSASKAFESDLVNDDMLDDDEACPDCYYYPVKPGSRCPSCECEIPILAEELEAMTPSDAIVYDAPKQAVLKLPDPLDKYKDPLITDLDALSEDEWRARVERHSDDDSALYEYWLQNRGTMSYQEFLDKHRLPGSQPVLGLVTGI